MATYWPRVAIFVTKCNPKLQCTPRTDLINDTDLQIIEITIDEVRKVQIFNLYNEKSLNDRETYTIDRLLVKYQPISTDQFVIYGDFNAHHSWWNSKIQNAIRSENLVKWLKLNKCSLINTPDLYTFFAHSGNSSSIIDLTFANFEIENAITNWSIDENAVTGSDHEVIRFELIASFKNLTSHATALSNKYNCNKADWDKFAKFLDENAINYESQIQSLLNNYQFDESALYLQNVIKNAAEMFIPKTKICAKSKNWWSQDLSGLRKIMCRHRREWKNNPSYFSHQTFRHSRIEYFHAIRKAKQQTWLAFLENAANKDVFTAYKYTKPRTFEKIPPIQYENKLNVQFDHKCDAFVSAMYTKNPFTDDNIEDLTNQDSENDNNWPNLTENELQNAISLFNPKKSCGPDAINFTIIQKSFQPLKNVFFTIYSKFIQIGYHPLYWRTGLGAVLKKPNKPDYSLPKSYRIITLLNCLGKIAEKIVANRLAYLGENSSLLDTEQMGGRKNHSAIDAVMNVVQDIEIANRNKNVLSCLLLDVKGAFDFVSINQLLNVMKKLHLSRTVIQWVKHFMTKRSINLIFDEHKSKTYYIESGIPQGSPISPILFLIYIRYLFPKIRMKFNAHSPSFIDDVAIYVENKTAIQNCKEIEIIVKTAFDWAATNNVKFDDDKSELIHFEKSRNASKDNVQLPNGTILEPKNSVKWLGVWLDRKLNYKKHVGTRIASANRSFFAIQNLMKSEWGLKPTACRQLYLSCIIPI